MVELIFSILGVIVLLGVVWGALCMVTGEKNNANTIMVKRFTAMVLLIKIQTIINLNRAGNGSLNEAVPMLDGLERYGNTSNFLKSNPAEFALNFVQLVTISLLVNYISNLFGNGSSNNIVGKLIGRIVIVMLAFIAYGFVWKMISENVVIKWCIYAVESLITVGAVSYPIMVLAASITGLKTNNYVLIYAVKQFPKTRFGRSVSAAITSSIMFLVLLVILESQYGTATNILQGVAAYMKSFGSVIVVVMGIATLVKSLKHK